MQLSLAYMYNNVYVYMRIQNMAIKRAYLLESYFQSNKLSNNCLLGQNMFEVAFGTLNFWEITDHNIFSKLSIANLMKNLKIHFEIGSIVECQLICY